MIKDWNFWVSVVTAAVAIIALIMNMQQIKLSNKQHLFEKRVEYYLIAKGLIQLYRINQSLLEKEEDSDLAVDFKFEQMTNNTYLEKITKVIYEPLKQPAQKEFLVKLETLKDVAVKIKLLFTGKPAILLEDFVSSYQDLLFEMYIYQKIINKMKELNEQFNYSFEKAQTVVNEDRRRKRLYDVYDNLKHIYDMIEKENVEMKLEKQIRIK